MIDKCVFLAGSPFSGKSTVGSLLSNLLGIPYYDLDNIIEDKGKTIPEIFSTEGETSFREIEKASLLEIISIETAFVLALGGGTLLDPKNLQLCKDSGIVITLQADITDILDRYRKDCKVRPLAKDESTLCELLMRREKHYSSLPNPIQTSNKLQATIAKQAEQLIRKHIN